METYQDLSYLERSIVDLTGCSIYESYEVSEFIGFMFGSVSHMNKNQFERAIKAAHKELLDYKKQENE